MTDIERKVMEVAENDEELDVKESVKEGVMVHYIVTSHPEVGVACPAFPLEFMNLKEDDDPEEVIRGFKEVINKETGHEVPDLSPESMFNHITFIMYGPAADVSSYVSIPVADMHASLASVFDMDGNSARVMLSEKVLEEMCSSLNVTRDDVIKKAISNLQKEAYFFPLEKIFNPDYEEDKDNAEIKMYVLGVPHNYGASAVLTDYSRKAAEKYPGKKVLFNIAHQDECIILVAPDNESLEEYITSLRELNATVVPDDEKEHFVSEKIYEFDLEKNCLVEFK